MSAAAASLDVPRYRIQIVSERTGVSTATLRAWERRYRVPEPARSDAHYRLYSEQDVAMVSRMAALCRSGIRPAEAARMARSERDPGRSFSEPAWTGTADLEGSERIVRAVRNFELDELRACLEYALEIGNAADAYDVFVSPALVRIGELWAEGALSIAHEHAAAHVIRSVLSSWLRLSSPPAPAPQVVLACFDGDQHELGLLGFALRAASWGYRPLYLGSSLPPSALEAAVARHRPAFVAISAVCAKSPTEARPVLTGYGKACGRVPWVVGGPAAPALADVVTKFGGIVAPAELESLHARLEALRVGITSSSI